MNFLKKYLRKSKGIINSKGLTLVELMVTLALLGIVLASIFSFSSFLMGRFNIAQDKSNVQQDILMAANYITKELRTATRVKVLDNESSQIDRDLYNSYIGPKDGSLVYGYNEKTRKIVKDNIVDLNFTLDQELGILKFSILGNEDGQEYKMDSEVALLNIEKTLEGNTTGSWIYYYNPFLN